MLYLTKRSFFTILTVFLWGVYISIGSSAWAKSKIRVLQSPTIDITSPPVLDGIVAPGTFEHTLYKIRIDVTDSATVLDGISFPLGGTYELADIDGFILIFANIDNFDFADFLDASPPLASGSVLSFGELGLNINAGESMFLWLLADISTAATEGHTIQVPALTNDDFQFAAGNLSGEPFLDGGVQTISNAIPTLLLNNTNEVPFFVTTPSAPSFAESYTISGTDLIDDVCIKPIAFITGEACDAYELSTNPNQAYADSLILPVSNGEIINQPVSIYMRLKAGLSSNNVNTEPSPEPFPEEPEPTPFGAYSCEMIHLSNGASPEGFLIDGFVLEPDSVLTACGLSTDLVGTTPGTLDQVLGWTLINGPDSLVNISDKLSSNPTITVNTLGTYAFQWLVFDNDFVAPVIDEVFEVTFVNPPQANLGEDLRVTGLSLTLTTQLESGTSAKIGSIDIPASNFSAVFSADSSTITITVPEAGTYNFLWEVSATGCPPAEDSIKIVFENNANDVLVAPSSLKLEVISPEIIQLNWSDEGSLETAYRILRRASKESSFTIIADVPDSVTSFQDNIPVLGELYFYRIQALNANLCDSICQQNCETCSQALGVVTEVPTALENPLLSSSTSAFPNPTTDIFRIEMDNNYQGTLIFSIFNINGHLVYKKSLQKFEKTLSFPINFMNQSSGKYLLYIQSDEGYTSKTLIKN